MPNGRVWNHLTTKFGENDEAVLYYAEKTIEKGWKCDPLDKSNFKNVNVLSGSSEPNLLSF